MKFELAPSERAELEPLVLELQKWIAELEAVDLEAYDPVLHPTPRKPSNEDSAPDD